MTNAVMTKTRGNVSHSRTSFQQEFGSDLDSEIVEETQEEMDNMGEVMMQWIDGEDVHEGRGLNLQG